MYIRPANAAYGGNPRVTPSNDWVIFFDGGGGCRDANDCLLTRWCSNGGQVFDQAGKMSAKGAPIAIEEIGGIFQLSPPGLVNQFAQYNQVLVHYCSSDNWIGSAKLTGLSTSTGISFDLQFQGEAIVNAVIGTLLAGPTAADATPARKFYGTPLPALSAATRVLIGGESAGTGIVHHLDRLRAQLLAANPAMDVRGVLDAGFPPVMWESGISWADPYSPGDYRDNLLTLIEPVTRSFWGANDSALDSSCLLPAWQAAHETITTTAGTTMGSHPQVCYDNSYVRLHHVTTRVFSRQDINDPVPQDRYVAWSLFPTSDAYWAAQYDQLGWLAVSAPPGGPLEPPVGPAGVQGVHCQKHVAIQTGTGFFRDRVSTAGLPPFSFHDLLANWVNGVGPGTSTIQIQTDNPGVPGYSASICF
jgi:hypothetical protein